MEKVRLVDMCFAFEQLSKVKKPSKRTKAAIIKLEVLICEKVECLQNWTVVPVSGGDHV